MIKKKIRSALPIYLAAAVWPLFALWAPMYAWWAVLLCALVSAAAYVVFGALIPPREIEVEVAPNSGDAEIDRQIAEGKRALRQIAEANEAIPSPTISRELGRMESAGMRIFAAVEQDTRKASNVRKFMNYYLPTTVKLIEHYRTLTAAGGAGENIEKSMGSIENSLGMIADAFEKQLDNLYGAEALDITTDIQVLETMMAGEGLTAEDSSGLKIQS